MGAVTNARPHIARFRFYAELNDFLPADRDGREIGYRFNGNPAVKDAIEAQGVPHAEVELILANGRPVGFDYQLADGDRLAVYPVFESFDMASLLRLRAAPLRESRFVVDVNLGKLARWSVEPQEQVDEVVRRFQLEKNVLPFHRCLACNGLIRPVDKQTVLHLLEPKTRRYYDEFHQCDDCGRVYWQGPHCARLENTVERLAGRLAGRHVGRRADVPLPPAAAAPRSGGDQR